MVRLDDFEKVVFFTGAGMSAESGVPTYRGEGGTWEKYDWERYACQRAFMADPEAVWDFHDMRREAVGKCEPHPGHAVIAGFLERHPESCVVTQNIDGMHQRAGATRVHELHGSLWRMRCQDCGARQENREAPLSNRKCACGAYWRPDITWFEDPLNIGVVEAALEAIQDCELLVSVGTSAVVMPAASFPPLAKRGGATLVEVNPEESMLSDIYDECLRVPASEGLTTLVDA